MFCLAIRWIPGEPSMSRHHTDSLQNIAAMGMDKGKQEERDGELQNTFTILRQHAGNTRACFLSWSFYKYKFYYIDIQR